MFSSGAVESLAQNAACTTTWLWRLDYLTSCYVHSENGSISSILVARDKARSLSRMIVCSSRITSKNKQQRKTKCFREHARPGREEFTFGCDPAWRTSGCYYGCLALQVAFADICSERLRGVGDQLPWQHRLRAQVLQKYLRGLGWRTVRRCHSTWLSLFFESSPRQPIWVGKGAPPPNSARFLAAFRPPC